MLLDGPRLNIPVRVLPVITALFIQENPPVAPPGDNVISPVIMLSLIKALFAFPYNFAIVICPVIVLPLRIKLSAVEV